MGDHKSHASSLVETFNNSEWEAAARLREFVRAIEQVTAKSDFSDAEKATSGRLSTGPGSTPIP